MQLTKTIDLADLVADNILTPHAADFLARVVPTPVTVVWAGDHSLGKTSLLSARKSSVELFPLDAINEK